MKQRSNSMAGQVCSWWRKHKWKWACVGAITERHLSESVSRHSDHAAGSSFKSSPEGNETRCHSHPPAGRLQYRPFITPLMWKDRICHKSDCPILGTLSWYASELCWHFSRWVSELKLNTAAPSPDYCRRQQRDRVLTQSAFSAFGLWADQIKCFITLQSIQSLLHSLSLCLIWHLYLFSDSIHPLGAAFYCLYSCSSLRLEPNTDTNIWQESLLLRKLHYIWACLHAHYITN